MSTDSNHVTTFDAIMRRPHLHSLWMAPLANKKFVPIASNNDMNRIQRVTDVGCGSGTCASYFFLGRYLGIDLNVKLICERGFATVHCRIPGAFWWHTRVSLLSPFGRTIRFFSYEFLHHVDDATAKSILANLSKLLTDATLFSLQLTSPFH